MNIDWLAVIGTVLQVTGLLCFVGFAFVIAELLGHQGDDE